MCMSHLSGSYSQICRNHLIKYQQHNFDLESREQMKFADIVGRWL